MDIWYSSSVNYDALVLEQVIYRDVNGYGFI